ncbi:phosphatidylglycerophosphatase A [Verrucomicrobia bacterium]|nr:phosphatidylglycerophosphatase A [Verrucomicrobiota bacterium]
MSHKRSRGDWWILWLAQGFNTGRAKVAPGTFGTFPGLVFAALFLLPGSLWIYLTLCVLSVPLSVYLSTRAEQILNQRDPGSIVIDEIIAVPMCFIWWVLDFLNSTGKMPSVSDLFIDGFLVVALIFGAFRFFDILKPWPVGPSQKLPRGWGVTIDDVLAAGYVNLVAYLIFRFLS